MSIGQFVSQTIITKPCTNCNEAGKEQPLAWPHGSWFLDNVEGLKDPFRLAFLPCLGPVCRPKESKCIYRCTQMWLLCALASMLLCSLQTRCYVLAHSSLRCGFEQQLNASTHKFLRLTFTSRNPFSDLLSTSQHL